MNGSVLIKSYESFLNSDGDQLWVEKGSELIKNKIQKSSSKVILHALAGDSGYSFNSISFGTSSDAGTIINPAGDNLPDLIQPSFVQPIVSFDFSHIETPDYYLEVSTILPANTPSIDGVKYREVGLSISGSASGQSILFSRVVLTNPILKIKERSYVVIWRINI